MDKKEIRSVVQRIEEILSNVKHATELEIVIKLSEDEYPTISYVAEEVAYRKE